MKILFCTIRISLCWLHWFDYRYNFLCFVTHALIFHYQIKYYKRIFTLWSKTHFHNSVKPIFSCNDVTWFSGLHILLSTEGKSVQSVPSFAGQTLDICESRSIISYQIMPIYQISNPNWSKLATYPHFPQLSEYNY